VKQDHGMRRCWLKGQSGDALRAVFCATGYKLRWLLRAIVRLGLTAVSFVLAWLRCFSPLTPPYQALNLPTCDPLFIPASNHNSDLHCRVNFAGPTSYAG